MSASDAPGVALGELAGQRLEVGELGDGAGRVAHAEPLLAVGHLAALAPRQVGPGLAQRVLQVGHLAGQPHVRHRLGHQVGQLGPLLGREPGHHAFLGGRPAGEGVDQLLDRLRVVREELPVLVHELAEPLVGVLAAVVRVDERGQVGDHVLDRLHVLLAGVLQRLLHRGERAVEHLPAQQVLDLLVGLPRLRPSATGSP